MKTPMPWFSMAVMLATPLLLVSPALAQESATVRLTTQIHEAPLLYSYYVFYICDLELARGDDEVKNRTAVLQIQSGADPAGGLSIYPEGNESYVVLEQEEVGGTTEVSIITDSPSVELRYYRLVRAIVKSNDDQVLQFSAPRVLTPVRGITTAINWPNWKFQLHKIEPEGAEMVMNPMFETDPYKSVSYYWYFSGADSADRSPAEVTVTLRNAATVSRVSRNQTILIVATVVCVPTAIFVLKNPPKKAPPKGKGARYRILDEREMRQRMRRSRHKVR